MVYSADTTEQEVQLLPRPPQHSMSVMMFTYCCTNNAQCHKCEMYW